MAPHVHDLPLSAAVPSAVCADWALVLHAAGIRHEVRAEGIGASLWVAPEDHARAVMELTRYLDENRARPAPAPRSWPSHRHAVWAVLAYAFVLVAIAAAALVDLGGRSWLERGALDAGFLARGEWWRAITALTLHAGPVHLLANLAFGAVFVHAAAELFGVGVALALVLAGAAGANALDALVHPADHRLLGASTAVFVALGLVAAYAWRRRAPLWSSARQRAAPLVAALALLGFAGTGGENTDVIAHLMGLAAGFALGVLTAVLPMPPPGRARPQWLAAAAAATLLGVAWLAALH